MAVWLHHISWQCARHYSTLSMYLHMLTWKCFDVRASAAQILSILKAREHHLAKMQVLLQERAAIARQAAELTMAATAQAPGMLEDVSNMSVLVQHGYLYFARNALLLHKMTELIKV